MPAFELMLHHLHRGQLPPPGPDPTLRMPGQHLVQRRPEPDRRELGLAEDVFDLVVLVEQAEVGGRVRLGEPGHLLGRPVPVQPHGELPAVRERDLLHRIWLGVAQAVPGRQAELIADEMDQQQPGLHVPGVAYAVDGDRYLHVVCAQPALCCPASCPARWQARRSERMVSSRARWRL